MGVVTYGRRARTLEPYRMSSHIDDEALERYSLGMLAEADAVEEHLLVCTGCQDRLAAADEYIQAMRQALSAMPPDKAKSSWLARLWPVPKMASVPGDPPQSLSARWS